MEINKLNSLVELFSKKKKQTKKAIFTMVKT